MSKADSGLHWDHKGCLSDEQGLLSQVTENHGVMQLVGAFWAVRIAGHLHYLVQQLVV